MKYLIGFVCVIWIASALPLAASEGDVGKVKTAGGKAAISRQYQEVSVKIGEKIYMGDTIKTGTDGFLGVSFRDNTLLSIGPDSEVVIDEFLFDPGQGKISFVTRMLKGTAVFLSGMIAKLSPKSFRVETPEATVAIRGTKFLVKVDQP